MAPDLKNLAEKRGAGNFVAFPESSGAEEASGAGVGAEAGAGATSKCIKSPQTFCLYVSASHRLFLLL